MGWLRQPGTHYQDPDSKVPSAEKPECPVCKVSVPILESQRDDGSIQDVAQDRSIIIFDDSGERDGQLPISDVPQTDVYSILEAGTQEEERRSILCK